MKTYKLFYLDEATGKIDWDYVYGEDSSEARYQFFYNHPHLKFYRMEKVTSNLI